jgi:S1-C subfamily serine protease
MDEVPDSPAELAAIEPGSIIFGVDTKVTRDISQVVNYIEGGKSPGDNIVLDVNFFRIDLCLQGRCYGGWIY